MSNGEGTQKWLEIIGLHLESEVVGEGGDLSITAHFNCIGKESRKATVFVATEGFEVSRSCQVKFPQEKLTMILDAPVVPGHYGLQVWVPGVARAEASFFVKPSRLAIVRKMQAKVVELWRTTPPKNASFQVSMGGGIWPKTFDVSWEGYDFSGEKAWLASIPARCFKEAGYPSVFSFPNVTFDGAELFGIKRLDFRKFMLDKPFCDEDL